MSNKTAMQEAINNIDYIINECEKSGQLNEFTKELLNDVVKLMLQSQLKVEREQIATAFEAGTLDRRQNTPIIIGETYYTTTYNQELKSKL